MSTKLTKDELIAELKRCAALAADDREVAHAEADAALLRFIDDLEITMAYDAFYKWHA